MSIVKNFVKNSCKREKLYGFFQKNKTSEVFKKSFTFLQTWIILIFLLNIILYII